MEFKRKIAQPELNGQRGTPVQSMIASTPHLAAYGVKKKRRNTIWWITRDMQCQQRKVIAISQISLYKVRGSLIKRFKPDRMLLYMGISVDSRAGRSKGLINVDNAVFEGLRQYQ